MEWNQAMSSNSTVFNYLPIHLRGEIIQIGAVKLTDDLQPGEEFQIDVKPVYFRKMHYRVKKLTGIDAKRLETACGFKEAFAQFRAFCGENCTFLTWGFDDKGILEQNIIIHDLDWDWIAGWYNLQLIYNYQTGGDKNQKALSTAMEQFQIEQTRVAHDALGDAYNTALICSRLDLNEGIKQYDTLKMQLSLRTGGKTEDSADERQALEHLAFTEYSSKADLIADEEINRFICPECGELLLKKRWVNQGDRRYMTIATCPDHGSFLARLKIKKTEDELWNANRILYKAEEDDLAFYQKKTAQGKKRRRKKKKSQEQS